MMQNRYTHQHTKQQHCTAIQKFKWMGKCYLENVEGIKDLGDEKFWN